MLLYPLPLPPPSFSFKSAHACWFGWGEVVPWHPFCRCGRLLGFLACFRSVSHGTCCSQQARNQLKPTLSALSPHSRTLRPGRACISCNTFPALAHEQNTSWRHAHRRWLSCTASARNVFWISLIIQVDVIMARRGPPSPLLLNAERAWNGHEDGTRGQLGRLCRGIPLEEHYQLRNFPRVVSYMPVQPNLAQGPLAHIHVCMYGGTHDRMHTPGF